MRAVGELPRRRVALAVCLACLLLAAAVPALRRPHATSAGSRGVRVLASSESFASVSVPPSKPHRPAAPVEMAPPPPPPSAAKRIALLIGVNHARGHRELQGAVKDATNLQTALVNYGFPNKNVVTLTDGAATAGRILAELDSLAARAVPDGRAVFSFAGHTELRGGVPHFVTADGGLIAAGTIAAKLARVRAPLWVALPTCYAGAYKLPGIIGPNRIATFSSEANRKSYELGPSGSWLILYMVEYAMLDRQAPESVEASFTYARKTIGKVNPDREPFMVDGFPGNFVLGVLRADVPGGAAYQQPTSGDGVSDNTSAGADAEASGNGRGPVRICTGVRFGCNKD